MRAATRDRLDFIKDLKRLYGTMDDEDLAAELGTTVRRVRTNARRLRLAKCKAAFKGRPMPRWDAGSEQLLRELYPNETNVDLAALLGRSVRAVATKASALGLEKSAEFRARMGAENVALRRDR